MHEIITLQFGQRSNYLATHFWNIQESYFSYSPQDTPLINHDVLFRPGLGEGGIETFTPRTVIYDLKGGFGSLRKINALYDAQSDASTAQLWDGQLVNQHQPAIEPSRYQSLLDSGLPTFQLHQQDVRYWSDFNRIFYHPRSAVQLNQYELHSELMPFENWSTGEDLFGDLDKEFDLLDRDVRPFAEECDQVQGMQLLTGTDDAWGGFTARYLDALRDEYGKSSLWVWGIQDTARVGRRAEVSRLSNVARSVAAFGQQASTYTPMATIPGKRPPYLHIEDNEWLTSALQCAAFESATLPTRLIHDSTQNVSLSVLEGILNTNGSQNIFDLQLSHFDHHYSNGNGTSTGELDGNNGTENASIGRFDIEFLPGQEQETVPAHAFARTEVIRSHPGAAALATDEHSRRSAGEEAMIEKFRTRLAFPVLDSFPDTLFRPTLLRSGSLELKAALSTTTAVREHILQLRRAVQQGVSVDDRESIYNDLSTISSKYSYGWDSGSDTGEDD